MASCLSPLLAGECLLKNGAEERNDELFDSCQEFTVHHEKCPGGREKSRRVSQGVHRGSKSDRCNRYTGPGFPRIGSAFQNQEKDRRGRKIYLGGDRGIRKMRGDRVPETGQGSAYGL